MEKLEQLAREIKGHGPGGEQAFQELYESTKKISLAVIKRYCDINGDYEDLLQETYIRVYKSIDSLQDETKVSAWINKIAANTAIRHNMKKWPRMFSELTDEEGNIPDFEDESGQFDPEAIADKKAVAQAVIQVIDTLPPDQRTALWMVYGQQITIKEMAESLGISENTIKSRLYQGRNKLLAKKDEFRRLGVELTAIPVAMLISMAFRQDVYAAVAWSAGAAAQAVGSTAPEAAAQAVGSTAPGAAAQTAGSTAPGAATKGHAASVAAAASGTAAKTGMALGTKVLLGVAAAAVVGGGAIAGRSILSKPASVAESGYTVETEAETAETVESIAETAESMTETASAAEETVGQAGSYTLTDEESAVLTELYAAVESGDTETLCNTVRDNLELLFRLDYETFQGQNVLFDGEGLSPLDSGTGMVVQHAVGHSRDGSYRKSLRVYFGTFRAGQPDGTLLAAHYVQHPASPSAHMDVTAADYADGVLDRSHYRTSFIDVRDRDGNPVCDVFTECTGPFPDESQILNGDYTVVSEGDTYELHFEDYDMHYDSEDEIITPVNGTEGMGQVDLAAYINSYATWKEGRPEKENVENAEY